ncbi:class I SAM-dependent rRNA methyltransferase [Deinococcus depolymerans]|uniref:Class I SAM-dependent rRNA methyltransferase n=1 Tax=Deinococcus depolymerans TaxID=392408 RepID=A0ABP3MER3_9DEIO
MKKFPTVTLQPQAVRRIAGRYPFGHSGDIARADDGIQPGEVVNVRAEGSTRLIARGYFNPQGATPLRLLTWQDEDIDLKFYRARIRAALARREGRIHNTDAMRVLHAEADGMPGVIADQFGSVLSVQLRNAGVERHRDLIVKALKDETRAESAYERSDTGERRREGLDLVTGTLWGDVPERVEFSEDNLRLHFAPMDAQKTGFFLDQRDNRRLMASLVRPGAGFLDVYSYTGGFSLHAAKAGAKATAIDKDNVALAALEQAARGNGLQVGVRWGDALEALAALEKDRRTFSAIVLDPPTLAKRRDDVPRAKRIFTEGAARALRMLESGGHLMISTCAHYIRVDDLLDAARVAAAEANTDAEVQGVTYQPADHPHLLSVPESLYLKSVLLRKA